MCTISHNNNKILDWFIFGRTVFREKRPFKPINMNIYYLHSKFFSITIALKSIRPITRDPKHLLSATSEAIPMSQRLFISMDKYPKFQTFQC